MLFLSNFCRALFQVENVPKISRFLDDNVYDDTCLSVNIFIPLQCLPLNWWREYWRIRYHYCHGHHKWSLYERSSLWNVVRRFLYCLDGKFSFTFLNIHFIKWMIMIPTTIVLRKSKKFKSLKFTQLFTGTYTILTLEEHLAWQLLKSQSKFKTWTWLFAFNAFLKGMNLSLLSHQLWGNCRADWFL